MWKEITGTSYVVDVRPVMGKFGAAAYLSKYLSKQLEEGSIRHELDKRGFIRRFSRSRNWKSGNKLQRRGTVEGTWFVTSFWKGNKFSKLQGQTGLLPEAEQMGDPYAEQLRLTTAVLSQLRRKSGDINLNGSIRRAQLGGSSGRSNTRVADSLRVQLGGFGREDSHNRVGSYVV